MSSSAPPGPVQAALARSEALLSGHVWSPPASPGPAARVVAFGDPQASAERFFGVLASHGLLGDDGALRPEVAVVSMGDHFDYDLTDLTVGRQGQLILSWLAAHRPDRAVILLGNHDAARVMELAALSDARFAHARDRARELYALRAGEVGLATFRREFPDVATPGLVARDYASFAAPQRALVRRLLLAGRYRLGAVGRYAGRELLLTHAAVTNREVALLSLAEDAQPDELADALNRTLARAVERVRPDWERGGSAPLDLRPLYVAGSLGAEGGGLLLHRPARPDRAGRPDRPVDRDWEFDLGRPRRFHPDELPRGLLQACGHTRPEKSGDELGDWVAFGEARPGSVLRTLRSGAAGVRYELGLRQPEPGEACLYMLDAGMFPGEAPYPVMELEAVTG